MKTHPKPEKTMLNVTPFEYNGTLYAFAYECDESAPLVVICPVTGSMSRIVPYGSDEYWAVVDAMNEEF